MLCSVLKRHGDGRFYDFEGSSRVSEVTSFVGRGRRGDEDIPILERRR